MDINLTPDQKLSILRDLIVALDARWFLKTSTETDFGTATKVNLSVNGSFGKTETRRVLAELGRDRVRGMNEFMAIMETGCSLFFPADHKYALEIVDDSTFVGHVLDCYVYRNVNRAGAAAIHTCSAAHRFNGWLVGLGLDGEATMNRTTATCNGVCDITFKINWPGEDAKK
jgi:hypothetical protein